VAGILVLFFALYNINFQLNVLGISSLSDLGINSSQLFNSAKNNSAQNKKELPLIVNGKQILKMDASSRGYSPNYCRYPRLYRRGTYQNSSCACPVSSFV
jgi:hypothetical protein